MECDEKHVGMPCNAGGYSIYFGCLRTGSRVCRRFTIVSTVLIIMSYQVEAIWTGEYLSI